MTGLLALCELSGANWVIACWELIGSLLAGAKLDHHLPGFGSNVHRAQEVRPPSAAPVEMRGDAL